MARSTKIQKIVTDALATRITATESGITTIQARDLVDVGDNISTLANDAQYQTLTQVDTKINALIGAAPGTLDTLGEIATALADDDSAIAALVAVNTNQNTAIAEVQTINAAQSASITAIETKNTSQDTAITALETSSSNLQGYIDSVANDLSDLDTIVVTRLSIQRRTIVADLQLTENFASRQNVINTSGATRAILLPTAPNTSVEVEIINHSTSTNDLLFAGETIVPGTRHAVQWDGVEWVVM
jgi:hypothetical protein